MYTTLHRQLLFNETNSRSSSIALKLLFSEDQTQVGDIILHNVLHLCGVQVRIIATEVLQWDKQHKGQNCQQNRVNTLYITQAAINLTYRSDFSPNNHRFVIDCPKHIILHVYHVQVHRQCQFLVWTNP